MILASAMVKVAHLGAMVCVMAAAVALACQSGDSSEGASAGAGGSAGGQSAGGSGNKEFSQLAAECTSDADCQDSALQCFPLYSGAAVSRCWYRCQTDADCAGVKLLFPSGGSQEYAFCNHCGSADLGAPPMESTCGQYENPKTCGSGGGSGAAGSSGSGGNACDACLSDCSGFSGCCTGCGCLCEAECQGCF